MRHATWIITSQKAAAMASLLETTTSSKRAIGEKVRIPLGKGVCLVIEANAHCTSMYLPEKLGQHHPKEQAAELQKPADFKQGPWNLLPMNDHCALSQPTRGCRPITGINK